MLKDVIYEFTLISFSLNQPRKKWMTNLRLTYCQSNDRVKSPMPSLFVAPPKTLVSAAALLPVAFMAAKHGIETEFNQGKI